MKSWNYQKRAWQENRNRIIQLLNNEPLTFKQVIEKSGLSRAVVNDHLKTLEKEGAIKKTYGSGKLLNILQPSNIDLVEWFLTQLANLGLPKETLEKGKSILNEPLLIISSLIYALIWNSAIDIIPRKILISESRLDSKIPPYKPFKIWASFFTKGKKGNFKVSTLIEPGEGWKQEEAQEFVKDMINELSPYSFNVVLLVYEIEKLLATAERELFFSNVEMPSDVEEAFEKTSEWWFNEVTEYLPSSGFFNALAMIYLAALIKRKQ